jgi:hypothetical protein
MGLTVPALLVVTAAGPGGAGWIPDGAAGWILPLATFALGAGLARLGCRAARGKTADNAVERGLSVPSYRRAVPALESELERARRMGRSLAVVVAKLVPGSLSALESRTAFALVGAYLDDCLRDIDLASSDHLGQRYIIALPEATRAQALAMVRRVGDLVSGETGVELRAGIAEFRSDGVMLEDLVRAAASDCDRQVSSPLSTERPPVLVRG